MCGGKSSFQIALRRTRSLPVLSAVEVHPELSLLLCALIQSSRKARAGPATVDLTDVLYPADREYSCSPADRESIVDQQTVT